MKFFIKLMSLVYWVLMFCACMTLLLAYAPRVAGVTPLAVTSNTMGSDYPEGNIVYVQKVKPEDLESGVNVTYINAQDGESTGVVKSVDAVSRNVNVLANGSVQAVAFDSVIGKPVATFPQLGNALEFCATRKLNVPVLAELIVAIVVLTIVFGRIKNIARDNI